MHWCNLSIFHKWNYKQNAYDSQLDDPWSFSSLFVWGLGGELKSELLFEAIEFRGLDWSGAPYKIYIQ